MVGWVNRRTGLEICSQILRYICRLIKGENRYADMENPRHPPSVPFTSETLSPTLSPQEAGLTRYMPCQGPRNKARLTGKTLMAPECC